MLSNKIIYVIVYVHIEKRKELSHTSKEYKQIENNGYSQSRL